jgi:hypothetical protein
LDPRREFLLNGWVRQGWSAQKNRAVQARFPASLLGPRAFVKLRELLSSNRELARRCAQLEIRLDKKLTEHDQAIAAIPSSIRQLMHPAAPATAGLGWRPPCRRDRSSRPTSPHCCATVESLGRKVATGMSLDPDRL